MATYNLLTEPWISVMDLSGKIKDMGILETLKEAHGILRIYDPSPPVEFGIYRLLIAFIMDVYKPQITDDLGDMLGSKRFDESRLRSYAAEWNRRFDLFDEKHPFMQVVVDENREKAPEPISRLMQHLPAGTGINHFHHGRWDEHEFSYRQCAKGLVTIPPFMTAGGAGLSPSINGSPPWYVLVKGKNLFETIVYNICVVPQLPKPIGDSPVVWKDDAEANPKKEIKVFSIIQGLTWRPRAIHLIPSGNIGKCTYSGIDGQPLVNYMHFAPGMKAPEPGLWADPQVSYVRTKDGIRPLRPIENKVLWRETGPLMLLQDSQFSDKDKKIVFERPAVVSQYTQMILDNIIPRDSPLNMEVYGMRTDGKMKIYEWYQEILNLPSGLTYKRGVGEHVQKAMNIADTIAYYVKQAIKKAYPRDGQGNDKALQNIIIDAQSLYWHSLRPIFNDDFLIKLSALDENDINAVDKLIEDWKTKVSKLGELMVDKALGPLDVDGKALRRQVEAMDDYRKRAWLLLHSELRTDRKSKTKAKAIK